MHSVCSSSYSSPPDPNCAVDKERIFKDNRKKIRKRNSVGALVTCHVVLAFMTIIKKIMAVWINIFRNYTVREQYILFLSGHQVIVTENEQVVKWRDREIRSEEKRKKKLIKRSEVSIKE